MSVRLGLFEPRREIANDEAMSKTTERVDFAKDFVVALGCAKFDFLDFICFMSRVNGIVREKTLPA